MPVPLPVSRPLRSPSPRQSKLLTQITYLGILGGWWQGLIPALQASRFKGPEVTTPYFHTIVGSGGHSWSLPTISHNIGGASSTNRPSLPGYLGIDIGIGIGIHSYWHQYWHRHHHHHQYSGTRVRHFNLTSWSFTTNTLATPFYY